MPNLIIDNIRIEAAEGTSVLEAARSAGIVIPHFCWHPALGRAGACRVCAVKILEGTPKGIQMSCMLPVQEGMVVSTTDPEAVELRRSVIEWLMINHPHDCPVCDEGGECQLQDFTIAGGHGIRRYDGRKRTHTNQYLGELIEHEMNRCIQCYRCARFYQEYAGGSDFGVMGRGGMVYFGRHCDGALESPFAGNLVDICPTGVFTDKTARYRARYWDYEMAPSVCPHCSLGCNTVPAARYRELLKTMARRNDAVNGWFICDRGRFSNHPVNAPDRPRRALVDKETTLPATALAVLVERLKGFLELHGPGSLAVAGSPRMDLEGNLMAARLAQTLGAGALCYHGERRQEEAGRTARSLLTAENSASQADVREADLIVIAGCDLLAEAPMLALASRQAWRKGARIYSLTEEDGVTTAPFPIAEAIPATSFDQIPLAGARKPVAICGISSRGLEAARHVASRNGKLAFVLHGPNHFGCIELSREQGAVSLEEALERGTIRGIIAWEADLPELPESVRVLAAADWRSTPLLRTAELVLPATAWVESAGTFVNHEGRAQRFERVMRPGQPIHGIDPSGHPPHSFRPDAPGSESLPSWHWIAEIIAAIAGEADSPFTGRWSSLAALDAEKEGISIL